MPMRTIFLATVLAAAIPAVSSAAGRLVRFEGCPRAGVQAQCVVVRSGPTTYNVTAAMPKIQLNGRGIAGRGLVSGGVSSCMQGVSLRGISYIYTRRRCPNLGR
jgi:hypothetical protein